MACWWCLLVCVVLLDSVSTSRKKIEKKCTSRVSSPLRVCGNTEVVGVCGDASRWRVGNGVLVVSVGMRSPVSTSRKNVPEARDASASRVPYVVVASAMLAALRVRGNAEVVGVGGDMSRWRVGNGMLVVSVGMRKSC
jgi:hypothetical protein